ncbi:Tfp pilus assembly protein PilF [Deinococcus cavernae]|uniref:Tfp pilus assembly protein PilF n=1 Tax=Deinococcus cavernae TaxID=2320857 RepID=A0A418VAH0_9DEIO|nr:Tfp pilus assembly protein PilF [Deinococcus cavernae]
MHCPLVAPHVRATRWLLTVALLSSASASAQTLIDTSAAVGIQNTLNNVAAPSPVPFIQRANTVVQTVQSQQAQAAAQVTTPSSSVSSPSTATRTVTVMPLTAQQQAALTAAQASFKAGNYALARTQYEALIAQNYNNPEPHFGLAMTLLSLKDEKGATFELGQFRLLAPERFEGPYNLGVIATRAGRYADALSLYAEAAKLVPGQAGPELQVQVWNALAGEQLRKADYAGLTTTLGALQALKPDDLDIQFRLAQAQFMSNQGAQALPSLYALLQKQPARTEAIRLLADIYAAQGLPERAIRELDAGLTQVKAGRDRAALLLHKANLLALTGDTKNAVFSAQAAHLQDRSNVDAWLREGQLRLQRSDRAGALKVFQGAVQAAPRDAKVRVELASLQLALKQYPQAAQNAAVALTLRPDAATQARAQYVQGVALYQRQQYAQARTLLNSSALAVRNADVTLWLGLANYALKDYAGAAAALTESMKLNPTLTVRQNLASALLAAARYSEAEGILQGIVKDNAKNSDAWYFLGLSQRAQLREEDARKSFKVAANLGNTRAQQALVQEPGK